MFVTNSDVMPSVERLGIDPHQVVRLPHAFDSDKLLAFAASTRPYARRMKGRPCFSHRHATTGSMATRTSRKGTTCCCGHSRSLPRTALRWRAVLVRWGRDLEASVALADELGIADRLEWVPPMRKRELWQRYLTSHVVADQFVLPAIGGVAFEAMALGRRLVTALDRSRRPLSSVRRPRSPTAGRRQQPPKRSAPSCAIHMTKPERLRRSERGSPATTPPRASSSFRSRRTRGFSPARVRTPRDPRCPARLDERA